MVSFAKAAAAAATSGSIKIAAEAEELARQAATDESLGIDEADATKARRRRLVSALATAAGLATVGGLGYLGYKHRDAIADKFKSAVKYEAPKPGYGERAFDAATSPGGIGAGVATATAGPLARWRGLLGKPATPIEQQTPGQRLRTRLTQLVAGSGSTNNATGLASHFRRFMGEGTTGDKGKPKGDAPKGGFIDKVTADPTQTPARRLYDMVAPENRGDVLSKLEGEIQGGARPSGDILPKTDAGILRGYLRTMQSAAQPGKLSEGARILAKDLGSKGNVGEEGVPHRAKLLEGKAHLENFMQPRLFSPRRTIGAAGRGILGAGAYGALAGIPQAD